MEGPWTLEGQADKNQSLTLPTRVLWALHDIQTFQRKCWGEVVGDSVPVSFPLLLWAVLLYVRFSPAESECTCLY